MNQLSSMQALLGFFSLPDAKYGLAQVKKTHA